jgi:hypothetical protein
LTESCRIFVYESERVAEREFITEREREFIAKKNNKIKN